MEIISFEKKTFEEISAAKVKPNHSLHPTLPINGILWHSWRKTAACFLVFNAKKSRNNHTTMDLQTTDGLLHRLSSCCIISGYDYVNRERAMFH